jgi:DNA-binding Xre family transcriptional regulator
MVLSLPKASSVMILIKLNRALEKREKSLYWLSASSGVSYVSLWKLSKKESQRSINLDILSKICSALNCPIQEILVYEEDEEDAAIKNLVKSKEKKEKRR